jgi:glycosyltransferase involved in cell wall biosynthesis
MKDIKKIALFGLGSINWIGGIQYITNIIDALDAISDEHPVEIHLIKTSRQNFVELPRFKKNKIVIEDFDTLYPPWSFTNRVKWFLQRKFTNSIYPRNENFFIDNGFDFVFPLTCSSRDGKLNVGSWIADFQYHHFPDGASQDFTAAAYNEISFTAHNSSKIILSSSACEQDCNMLFPETKGKTISMPFTVFLDEQLLQFNDFSSLLTKYRIPEYFLIVSNSFSPTKNHKTLFRALQILNEQGIKVPLVCTGNIVDQRNLHFGNEVMQMLTEYKVRDQVHILGIIPRADQVALYRMSKAMVQPSVNEGWSTPVEEAKNLGKHLIVSDIEVHKEQCPGNLYIFQKLNAEDLADKIKQVWMPNLDKKFPDIEQEKKAFAAYREQVKVFGRRFLEVAAR